MARVPRAISSVYVPSVINRFIFGQWVVIYFIMQHTYKLSLFGFAKSHSAEPGNTQSRVRSYGVAKEVALAITVSFVRT